MWPVKNCSVLILCTGQKYSHHQLVQQMTQLIEEIYQFKVAKLSIFESIWNAETLN